MLGATRQVRTAQHKRAMGYAGVVLATGAAVCWGYLYSSTQVLLTKLPLPILAPFAFVACGAAALPFFVLAMAQPGAGLSSVPKTDLLLHVASFLLARLLNVYAVVNLGGDTRF